MSWTPTDEQALIEKMAAVIDPVIVEPDRTTVMNAWRYTGLDAEECMAEREHEARAKARAVLVAVGPHIAAQGWDEASEWVADPHVARGLRQANPYRQEAGQ